MWLNTLLICLLGYFVNGMVIYVDRLLNYLPSFIGRFKISVTLAVFTPFGFVFLAIAWRIIEPFYLFFLDSDN